MTKEYNQLAQDDTNQACSVYAFINSIKYDYGIIVEIDTILSFLIYLEKIGAFFRLKGAYAVIIYPAIVKYISIKLGFSLKIGKATVSGLGDKRGYILGFKRATSSYIKNAKDGEITKSDIDSMDASKFAGHFHYWKRDKIVESIGGFRYKMTKDTLKYAFSKDAYFPNIRYIYGEEKLQETLIEMVKERKKVFDNPYLNIRQAKDIKRERGL